MRDQTVPQRCESLRGPLSESLLVSVLISIVSMLLLASTTEAQDGRTTAGAAPKASTGNPVS